MELTNKTRFHKPELTFFERDGIYFALDGDSPNWIATDERGDWILKNQNDMGISHLIASYSSRFKLDPAKSWLHVDAFLQDLLRHEMISTSSIVRQPYLGRQHYLKPTKLHELWLHTNNSCNLTCTHCLVSSSPKGEKGLPLEKLISLVDQAAGLGVYRFYITGGEPFVRQDMVQLMQHITQTHRAELILLTNATQFHRRELLGELDRLDRSRLKFQVSLDGATPKTNDPIRGEGSFNAATDGVRHLAPLGFDITLTTAVTATNLGELPKLVYLAKELGVRALHLMWLHRRGRILEEGDHLFPSVDQLIAAVRQTKEAADEVGIVLDNYESMKLRINGQRGVKYDLGNAGWQSFCVYADGHVYPSAALANIRSLDCGDAVNPLTHPSPPLGERGGVRGKGVPLKEIWLESPILESLRRASLVHQAELKKDPFRFLLGGGDIEQSLAKNGDYRFTPTQSVGVRKGTRYHWRPSSQKVPGTFFIFDPYYPLYKEIALDVMSELASRKKENLNRRSGFDAPVIFHGMGDGAIVCGMSEVGEEDVEVAFLHSNCVLSFDVEKPRRLVREFYGKAAEIPQAELCCPTKPDFSETEHIPKEVVDRFYGCGSPVTQAQPKPGETYVDLGSGAGIDCFIAAKKVGSTGKVIGIDMTDEMLKIAEENKPKVAEKLGYDVVEFRKGYLEKVPIEDKSVDVVTSNCVINLSPDKPAVFAEIWRILKDHGRVVIADIVSDREVPARLKINPQLWGECTVGALTEAQFLSMLEQAGFYGLSVLKKVYWRAIEGYDPSTRSPSASSGSLAQDVTSFHFYSVTVQGFKFEKTKGCCFIGQKAIYRGPFKSVMDEEGHLFPRNEVIEVCTDTAAKLKNAPYQSFFAVIEPDGTTVQPLGAACCDAEGTGGSCC